MYIFRRYLFIALVFTITFEKGKVYLVGFNLYLKDLKSVLPFVNSPKYDFVGIIVKDDDLGEVLCISYYNKSLEYMIGNE